MKISNATLMAVAIGSILSVGAGLGLAQEKETASDAKEKCYGVVKAAKNECAGNGHACAGQATKNGDPGEWIYVPKGTCERLVNGVTK